jgi:hypothetical protein
MGKIDLDNLEPERKGITILERGIKVEGYNKERGIQTFFDGEEIQTSRVRGVNIDNKHYMVNEDDYDYGISILECPDLSPARRVYRLDVYNRQKAIAYGSEILYGKNNKNLIHRICLALSKKYGE